MTAVTLSEGPLPQAGTGDRKAVAPPPPSRSPADLERLARFDPPLDLPVVPKFRHLLGQEAEDFQEKVIAAYRDRHAAIKDICAATTRSYGTIHGILKRCGVQRRCRGGPHPSRAAKANAVLCRNSGG